MIKLKEIVPYDKSSEIEKGVSKKYPDLKEDTFGVDMEFHSSISKEQDPWDYWDSWSDEASRASNGWNRQLYNGLSEWMNDKRESVNARYNDRVGWDDEYGPVDVDTWDVAHTEPERSDFEDGPDGDVKYEIRRRHIRAYSCWSSKRHQCI